MTQDSYITHGEGHTTFVGPDATRLFAAAALRSGIMLYLQTGMKVSSHATPKNMQAMASRYTGKAYKRGQLRQAAADLQIWIDAMKAALPIRTEGTP